MVSTSSTPGTSGWPGKCPSKTGLSAGTTASAAMLSGSTASTRSIIWKYSRRTALPSGSSRLGGHQFLDPRRQVLQHEVLLGRGGAGIDFLGPGLDRDLDAEGLVDCEDDVEEVQAVDAEIIDHMAVGRDLLAGDVGRLRDDVGDAVERRSHGESPDGL